MEKKENEKSTPVPTPQPEVENHVNQSTEEKQSSNNGILAIIIGCHNPFRAAIFLRMAGVRL